MKNRISAKIKIKKKKSIELVQLELNQVSVSLIKERVASVPYQTESFIFALSCTGGDWVIQMYIQAGYLETV